MNACIVSVGARTPLGLDAPSSAAAVRAGIIGATERVLLPHLPWTTRHVAIDARLPESLIGARRLSRMLHPAVIECLSPVVQARKDGSDIPVFLALPEPRPGFGDSEAEDVRQTLARANDTLPPLGPVRAFASGHAAGAAAFDAALVALADGSTDVCLVAGVDSYHHPDTYGWLNDTGRLAGGQSRSAFVAGEGAGTCLLMSSGATKRAGVPPLVRLLGASLACERAPKDGDARDARALTDAVAGACRAMPPGIRAGRVLCDLNGERARSEAWAFSCLRVGEAFEDVTAFESPADAWGDVGAASLPLYAMLACSSVVRGYARDSPVIAWAFSDGGDRGALALAPACVDRRDPGES